MISRSAWAVFFVTMTATVWAAEPRVSLTDVMARAMASNLSVELASINVQSAEALVFRRRAELWPKVSIQAGYSQSNQDTVTTLRTSGNIDVKGAKSTALNYGLSTSYLLFDGGMRAATVQSAELAADASVLTQRLLLEQTVVQVSRMYYELAKLTQNLQVNRESVAISKDRVLTARQRLSVGSATRLDLLKAEVDLNADEMAYLRTEHALNRARRALNTYAGFPVTYNYVVDPAVTIDVTLLRKPLLDEALRHNTALKISEANLAIREKDQDRLAAVLWPRLSLSADYSRKRSEAEASTVQSSTVQGLSFGGTLQWTIFDGFGNHYEAKVAALATTRQRKTLVLTAQELRRDVLNEIESLNTNLEILTLIRKQIKTAELGFNVATQNYQSGRITSTELREAQRNLMLAKFQYHDALYTTKIIEQMLLALTGRLLLPLAEQ